MSREPAPDELGNRTVADFGEQWTRYTDNSGYYGSLTLFRDVFGPLIRLEDVHGKRVLDIGSGTGRIVRMLLAAGAAHVTAVEPSDAFDVLAESLREFGPRVTCLRRRGADIEADDAYDLVVAVGVLHHLPDPLPVAAAAFRALRPGGCLAVWLYGCEGNGAYLALVRPLRALTTRLPHAGLVALSWTLTLALSAYAVVCRALPLPLHRYMREVIDRLTLDKRYLVVYDQLNPAYSKYYRREEAQALLSGAGFADVRLYHRHGYSWSVVGRKPGRDA